MRCCRNNTRNKGFTLIEIMVALLITGILMVTVISVFLMSQKVYSRGESISYKHKSITNIETDLQNSLAVASETGVAIATLPGGDYSIGFKDGKCMEVIGGEMYETDQITQIELKVVNGKTMAYVITPKDNMATLTGGIVMNNLKNNTINETLNKDNEKFLVISYETGQNNN